MEMYFIQGMEMYFVQGMEMYTHPQTYPTPNLASQLPIARIFKNLELICFLIFEMLILNPDPTIIK
jgi:hypothetical protein